MINLRKERTAKILFAVFLFLCCAVLFSYSIKKVSEFPKWIVDDAFIIFRYAENFAVHGELNWNPGENPTEGYTGVVMVWLISAMIKLGMSPVTAAHILGILFYYLGAALLVLMFRGINLSSLTALALYLTAPFFYIHAWSGLETTMFTSLIIFAIYGYSVKKQRLFVAAILLLSLARPEGILLSGILLIIFRPFTWTTVLLYGIPFSVYYIWRWGYYGQLLPNTFYAKFAVDAEENTMQSLREYFTTYLMIPMIVTFVLAVREKSVRNVRLIIGLAIYTVACLGVYLSSHLVMNYAYRFFVPFYPLVLLALGAVLYTARRDLINLLLIVLLFIPQYQRNTDRRILSNMKVYARNYRHILEDEHIKIGNYLRENIDPDEWLVVHADAGAIPYYSKLKTLDCGRLNDEYLARNAPSPEETAEYIYSHNPGVMVFTSTDNRVVRHGPEAEFIRRDKRFGNYKLAKIYSSRSTKKYFEFVYLRNDIADSLGIVTDENIPKSILVKPKRAKQSMEQQAAASLIDDGNISTPQVGRGRSDWTDVDFRNADDLWNFARREKDRNIRRSLFEKFYRLHINDDRAPEALWEAAMTIESPAGRIENLRVLYERYPDNEIASKALFTIGLIYSEEIKDVEKASDCFRELIEKYPASSVTETARWMLENAGGETPNLE